MSQLQDGHGFSEDRAFTHLSSKMGKHQARELLMNSLPVRDEALVRFLETLAQVGAAARSRRQAEEKRSEQIRTQRQETHVSYSTVLNNVLQSTGGRHLTPVELAVHFSNSYSQQMRAAQPAYAGQPQPGQPGDGNKRNHGNGLGTTAHGTPQAQSSIGIPAKMPGNAGVRPSAVNVNVQQLTNILQSNKLPDGSPLTDEFRKKIEDKRQRLIVQHQQAMAQRQAISASQQQGQQTNGQMTAMHAQNQAALQVNRPQMGTAVTPGIHMYANAGAGQAMGGMSQLQMQQSVAPGTMMNNVQGAMAMPAAQQQYLQQQMMQRPQAHPQHQANQTQNQK